MRRLAIDTVPGGGSALPTAREVDGATCRRFTGEDQQRCAKYYHNGLNDCEIGRRLDRSPATIQSWRKRNNLPANGNFGGRFLSRKEHDRRLTFYRLGWSDCRIAKSSGTTRSVISDWRRKHKLPAKHKFECSSERGRVLLDHVTEDRRLALYRRGLSDGAIASEVGLKHGKSILEWRQRRQLPANSGQRKWQRDTRFNLSLDYEFENGVQFMDVIGDASLSEQLEEMGATAW